jgi:hypothetical protein
MPLQIRFVELTLSVVIPVCSRTEEEAQAIACEVLGDKIGIMHGDAPDISGFMFIEEPFAFETETVWGEAVPEEAMTVCKLREWLSR